MHYVEAVYRHEVEALVDAAEAIRHGTTSDTALAEWMQRFVDYVATNRGMRDTLLALKQSQSPSVRRHLRHSLLR